MRKFSLGTAWDSAYTLQNSNFASAVERPCVIGDNPVHSSASGRQLSTTESVSAGHLPPCRPAPIGVLGDAPLPCPTPPRVSVGVHNWPAWGLIRFFTYPSVLYHPMRDQVCVGWYCRTGGLAYWSECVVGLWKDKETLTGCQHRETVLIGKECGSR